MIRSIIQIAAVGYKRGDGDGEENALYALADDGSVWTMAPEQAYRGSAAWKSLPMLPQMSIPFAWLPDTTLSDAGEAA